MAQLNLENGSAGKRLGAKLLDGVPSALITGAAVVVALPLIGYEQVSADTARLDLSMFYLVVGIGSLVSLVYWIFMWGWEAKTGKTLGNVMLGLRTTNLEGFAPGWLAVFVRSLIIGLSGIIPVIGFILVMISNLFDSPSQRQGWHDKAARTLVFDVRRGRNPLTSGGIGGPASFAPPAPPPAVQPIPSPLAAHRFPPPEEAPTGTPASLAAPPAQASSPSPEPHAYSAPAPASFAPPPTAVVAAAPEKVPTGRTTPLPENQPTHPDLESEQTIVTRRAARNGVRIVLDDGRTLVLQSTALVGRNPAAGPADSGTTPELIPVKDEGRSVSKTHLGLRVEDGRLWVTDRNSTNGSGITGSDGVRSTLTGGKPYLAEPGSTVHFGDRSFRVEQP